MLCEWDCDEGGNWKLIRQDTYAVVGRVDNVYKRKNYNAFVGEEEVAHGERYLACAKGPVETRLDELWSKAQQAANSE